MTPTTHTRFSKQRTKKKNANTRQKGGFCEGVEVYFLHCGQFSKCSCFKTELVFFQYKYHSIRDAKTTSDKRVNTNSTNDEYIRSIYSVQSHLKLIQIFNKFHSRLHEARNSQIRFNFMGNHSFHQSNLYICSSTLIQWSEQSFHLLQNSKRRIKSTRVRVDSKLKGFLKTQTLKIIILHGLCFILQPIGCPFICVHECLYNGNINELSTIDCVFLFSFCSLELYMS